MLGKNQPRIISPFRGDFQQRWPTVPRRTFSEIGGRLLRARSCPVSFLLVSSLREMPYFIYPATFCYDVTLGWDVALVPRAIRMRPNGTERENSPPRCSFATLELTKLVKAIYNL